MKSFLHKVMGERSNLGHLWLSAALSFVITHLEAWACERHSVAVLSVLPVCVWLDPGGE